MAKSKNKKNTVAEDMLLAAKAANRHIIPPRRVEKDRKKDASKKACRGKFRI